MMKMKTMKWHRPAFLWWMSEGVRSEGVRRWSVRSEGSRWMAFCVCSERQVSRRYLLKSEIYVWQSSAEQQRREEIDSWRWEKWQS